MSFASRLTNFVGLYFPALGRAATMNQVAQYRSSKGGKGKLILGYPCFPLEVTGRKSGNPHSVMLMYVPRGDDLIVVGSAGGTHRTPHWYKNLVAAGGGNVQVDAERWDVTVRELPEGREREECWAIAVSCFPGFEDYRGYTERRIPVAVLERKKRPFEAARER